MNELTSLEPKPHHKDIPTIDLKVYSQEIHVPVQQITGFTETSPASEHPRLLIDSKWERTKQDSLFKKHAIILTPAFMQSFEDQENHVFYSRMYQEFINNGFLVCRYEDPGIHGIDDPNIKSYAFPQLGENLATLSFMVQSQKWWNDDWSYSLIGFSLGSNTVVTSGSLLDSKSIDKPTNIVLISPIGNIRDFVNQHIGPKTHETITKNSTVIDIYPSSSRARSLAVPKDFVLEAELNQSDSLTQQQISDFGTPSLLISAKDNQLVPKLVAGGVSNIPTFSRNIVLESGGHDINVNEETMTNLLSRINKFLESSSLDNSVINPSSTPP